MQGRTHTFVKSVGHHTTEVTSSLWPWSVMGGCLGSEIYNANIFNTNGWNTAIILFAKKKTTHTHRTYLPDICVIVARTACQELVIWANSGFYIEWGVLVTTENWHCGGTLSSMIMIHYNPATDKGLYKMPQQDIQCQEYFNIVRLLGFKMPIWLPLPEY